MTKTQRTPIFYAYFIAFLFFSYLAREILTPVKYNFVPLYQIIAIPLLIILAKNSLYNNKTVSWIAFTLVFVFFWELSNYIPVMGFYIFAYLHYYNIVQVTNLDLIFSLQYITIFFILLALKNRILLFFSVLTATKKSKVNKLKFKVNGSSNKEYFSPDKAMFYFNELTQVLSIVYKSNKFIYKTKHFVNDDIDLYFTPKKGNYNPSVKKITINDPLMIIEDKKVLLVFFLKDLTSSMKQHLLSTIKEIDTDYIVIESNANMVQKPTDPSASLTELHMEKNKEPNISINEDSTETLNHSQAEIIKKDDKVKVNTEAEESSVVILK